jgi:hypothetical protein
MEGLFSSQNIETNTAGRLLGYASLIRPTFPLSFSTPDWILDRMQTLYLPQLHTQRVSSARSRLRFFFVCASFHAVSEAVADQICSAGRRGLFFEEFFACRLGIRRSSRLILSDKRKAVSNFAAAIFCRLSTRRQFLP